MISCYVLHKGAGIRVGRSFIIDSKLETEAAVTIWLLHSTMGTGTQLTGILVLDCIDSC